MKKIYFVLTIVSIATLIIFICLFSSKIENNRIENKLNTLDSKILDNFSIDYLKHNLDIDKAVNDLNEEIRSFESGAKRKLTDVLKDLDLSPLNTWKEFEDVIDKKCKEEFNLSLNSREFKSFYHANFISDGDKFTAKEIEENSFYSLLSLYNYCLDQLGTNIDDKLSIVEVLNLYLKNNRYNSIIEPYIESKSKNLLPSITLSSANVE